LSRAGRRGGEKNRPPENGSGVTESCVSLRIKMGNISIVRRWRIMIGNHWRMFFFLFPNKTRIGKRNRELLEMLFRTFASSATNIFKLRLVTKWEEI